MRHYHRANVLSRILYHYLRQEIHEYRDNALRQEAHEYRDNVLLDSELYIIAIIHLVLELYLTTTKMYDGRRYEIIATT